MISIFGITGDLRQEFRKSEVLDEITCLRYKGKSSLKINSIIRSELIHSFIIWKGEVYVLKTIHQKLRWSNNDPFYIEDVVETLPWKIILDQTTEIKPIKNASIDVCYTHYYVSAKETETLQTTSTFTGLSKSKCFREDEDSQDVQLDIRVNKKVKSRPTMQHKFSFRGFIWSEHRCVYDSLLTILLAVYLECKTAWNINILEYVRELEYIGGIFRQATE